MTQNIEIFSNYFENNLKMPKHSRTFSKRFDGNILRLILMIKIKIYNGSKHRNILKTSPNILKTF